MMMRVLFVATALLIAVGAMLAQLWVRGMPVRQAIKTAVFGAGFVVSVKMTLGGYLALQGGAEPTMIEVVGFAGSLGLALCFGWATLSLWRRGTSKLDG